MLFPGGSELIRVGAHRLGECQKALSDLTVAGSSCIYRSFHIRSLNIDPHPPKSSRPSTEASFRHWDVVNRVIASICRSVLIWNTCLYEPHVRPCSKASTLLTASSSHSSQHSVTAVPSLSILCFTSYSSVPHQPWLWCSGG